MTGRAIWIWWMVVAGFGCYTDIAAERTATDIGTAHNAFSVDEAPRPLQADRISAQNELSREMHDVLVARWEGFKRVAQSRPDNDLLAVELTRTLDGETAVAFTVAQNSNPVRYVVVGDGNGGVNASEYEHPAATTARGLAHTETFTVSDDGSIDPSVIALGIPPPQQPGTPGVIAAGFADGGVRPDG